MNAYAERARGSGRGPTLLRSFLVYMDALGTEAAVSGPQEAIEARFQSFRTAWAKAMEISGLSRSSSLPTSVFSDLVVAGLPIRDDGEAELTFLLSTVSSFQFFLSIEGIFVRGALVEGDAWIDEAMTYGPALAQAHQIERQDAVYPRIVVSRQVQDRIRSYKSYYGGEAAALPQGRELLVDSAGVLFVDYLQSTFISPEQGQQIEAVSEHKSAVVSGLLDTVHNPRAQDKMYWSARYHNHFVSEYFDERTDLLVETRDPRLEFLSLADHWAAESLPFT